jgi:hypothetical protein
MRMRLRRSSFSGSVSREREDVGEGGFAALSIGAAPICCPAISIATVPCSARFACSAISSSPAFSTERTKRIFFWLRSRLGDGDKLLWSFIDVPESFLRRFEMKPSLSSDGTLLRLKFSGVGISSLLSGSDVIRVSLCSREVIRAGHGSIGEGNSTAVDRYVMRFWWIFSARCGTCSTSKRLVPSMFGLGDWIVDIATAERIRSSLSCGAANESCGGLFVSSGPAGGTRGTLTPNSIAIAVDGGIEIKAVVGEILRDSSKFECVSKSEDNIISIQTGNDGVCLGNSQFYFHFKPRGDGYRI